MTPPRKNQHPLSPRSRNGGHASTSKQFQTVQQQLWPKMVRENQVPKCETWLACLYLTALGGGVTMGWACSMVGCVFSCWPLFLLLDVFFNVVFCCLLMCILIIIKIKGTLNQPLLSTNLYSPPTFTSNQKLSSFSAATSVCLKERKHSFYSFFSLFSLWLQHAMI